MPWVVRQIDEEWCVYRQGPDGEPEGEALGCHASEDEAQAQRAALYASENAPVKAVLGEDGWQLDVLGVPFGSPDNRDADGEFFSDQTRLHEDKFPLPPVVYYHGYGPDRRPAGEPAYIGRTVKRWRDSAGEWFRVVLDQTSELARRVWEAAKRGLARASSGSARHLSRVDPDGHIREWPVVELSVFDTGGGRQPANRYAVVIPAAKAVYHQAGITPPDDLDGEAETGEAGAQAGKPRGAAEGDGRAEIDLTAHRQEQSEMDDHEIQMKIDAALAARDEAARAAAEHEAEVQRRIDEAVKAREEQLRITAGARLPFNGDDAPRAAQFGDLRRFEHLTAADQAFLIGVLRASGETPSEAALKALVVKLEEDQGAIGHTAKMAMKGAGIKANEINYSTLSSYGDEWAGVAYSQAIWESIRHETIVADKIPAVEVPEGYESIVIPIEGGDPTFYRVSQVTSDAATGGLSTPAPTVTSSRLGTSNTTLSTGKLGARLRWSDELNESSIIQWAPQLRAQLSRAGAETFEHVIIDGDTATTASTNINLINGTPTNQAYLVANGFRKLALVTNTNNARSGGTLSVEDYLETIKLMGAGGKNAADPARCAFIVDTNVHWKTAELPEVKTRDVNVQATIENGMVTHLWRYPVYRSFSMHYASRAATGYEYKANTAGKISSTAASNTTGSLLAVRWDQWLLGWKSRMKLTVTPHPEWDGFEIVAIMRFGLVYRDTDAAAISYNLTV